MDIKDRKTVATNIGLGVPVHEERNTKGLVWILSGSRKYHTSISCSRLHDHTLAKKVPAYTEGDKTYIERDDGQVQILPCGVCPNDPGDQSWREQAACQYSNLDFISLNREALEVCSGCPVQLECLEFGALDPIANRGAIWGGLYFRKGESDNKKRNAEIEQRRKELHN